MRWVSLCLLTVVAWAADPTGLVNGSFATATANPDLADGWSVSGDQTVVQKPRRELGPDGVWSQVLDCTALTGGGPASHAMLAQVNTIHLQQGHWYRFEVTLKAQHLASGTVQVAISNMANWTNCGLQDTILVGPEWTTFETTFQATQTVTEKARLQLWWSTVGTVWFRNVKLEESGPPKYRYVEQVPPVPCRNLVPNSGFEAGPAGWGSVADLPGWGGNLNALVGDVVADTPHSGLHCLKVALTPETTPVYWFDYYQLVRHPVRSPFAANRGWLALEPGRKYTLSAWLRAEPAGLSARLRVVQSNRAKPTQKVNVPGTWTRASLTFTAAADQAYVAVGPDLEADQRDRGTLWVDDVMLEAADQPGEYEPRTSVEVGVRPTAEGGLYQPGQTPELEANVSWPLGSVPPFPKLRVRATDYRDQPAGQWDTDLNLTMAMGGPVRAGMVARIPLTGLGRGFYRVTVETTQGTVSPPLPLRIAIIPFSRRGAATVCGMNHGYPEQNLLDLSRRIGLGWFRDWSFKWADVEPEPGKWAFGEADAQVDRVLARQLGVLALLPFPSARWASTAPKRELKPGSEDLDIVAMAPRDPADLANYVRATVAHLKGRVDTVEIFNEPVYTQYALPRKNGYTAADYARYLEIAARAAREGNPQVRVLGGIQALPADLTREFIEAGGLKWIDATTVHHYPGGARPETMIGPFDRMREWMAAAGKPNLPIWWTEGAYYADDDPVTRPYRSQWMNPVPTETMCTNFTIRMNAILCGHDVRRICYHSGTPGTINEVDPSGIYFEYDAAPRKMTAGLATFNELIGPDFVNHGRVKTPEGSYAYRFDSDGRTVIIAWAPGERRAVQLDRRAWQALDVVGQPIAGDVVLSDEPVYLVADGPNRPAPALP